MTNRFNQRLKLLREKRKLTQSELAKSLPMKVSTVSISQWETGITEPKMSNLKSLAEFFDVSIEWLTTGKARVRSLSFDNNDVLEIPAIELDDDVDLKEQCIFFDRNIVGDAFHLGWFEVAGNSMAPQLSDGTIVVVDRDDKSVKDGCLYLIDIGGALRVKKLSQTFTGFVVSSYNNEYPDELFNTQAFLKEFKILGRVMKVISSI